MTDSQLKWATDDSLAGVSSTQWLAHAPQVGPRFKISAVLGAGSFGTVYAARDLTFDTRVALKLLHQSSAESLYRFKREFRALRDLRHPNLVRYGELLEYQRRWFFTLELIDGLPLLEFVRPGATRELDLARLASCMRQLADGLLALHAQGLVHRDIKPSNILVDSRGRLVLLDFGLVADARDGLGETNNVVGTVAYMSPEQSSGAPLTAASDWYSAGCMLYEALTQRLPFEGSPVRVLMQKQQRLPPSPTQLGLVVPEVFEGLCMALLALAPDRRAGAREVLAALGAVPQAEDSAHSPHLRQVPFVGRRAELTMLDSALEQAVSGASVGVAVLGESGMGKTALVMQAVQRFCARHASAVVLFGRCYERESVPYNAFDGVIDELTRHLCGVSRDRQALLAPRHGGILAQVFPVLERVPALASRGAPLDTADPQTLRRSAFRALRELFVRMSETAPVAIVIDDLQWADQESLALLEELVRAPEAPRLLLAFTMRPLEQCPEPVRAGLDRIFSELDKAQRLHLAGLLPDDAVALARHLSAAAGDSTRSTDLRAMIEDARGHPLFIDTLVRSRGVGAPELGAELSVEEALRQLVNNIDDQARSVLELLCLAAAGTDRMVLSRAAHIAPDRCGVILSVLEGRKLVRASRDEHRQEVEPFHDRVRAAVISVLQQATIARLHVRLADAMVSLARNTPERIAWHYRSAGRLERALKYVLEAAERAALALAFDRAAELYAEAIVLSPQPDVSLIQRRAEALANAGRSAEAGDAFHMAAGMVTSEAMQLRLELLRRAADQFLRVGRLHEGLEAAAAALSGIGVELGLSPRAALLSLVFERGRLAWRGLSFETRPAEQWSTQQLNRVDLLWSLGVTLSTMDHVRSTALLARGLREALNAGDERRISRALSTEAISLSAIDRPPFKRTAHLLAVSGAIAERRQDAYTRAFHALCSAGVALAARDHFRECVQQATRAQQLFRDECRGVVWEIGQASLFELSARAFLGQFRELSARCQASLRAARECGDKLTERSIASTAAVWAHLSEDRPGAAQTLLAEQLPEPGKGPILVQDIYRILSEAVIGLYTRNPHTLTTLEGLRPALSRSMLLRVRLFRVQFLAWHGRAALLATRGAVASEGFRLLKIAESDARALAKCGTPQSEGHALLIRAGIARRRGHAEAELACLREARDLWSEHHCAPFAAAADLRMAKLLGGGEGEEHEERAAAFFRREGILHPRRFCGILVA